MRECKLFTPIAIGSSLTLNNRIVVPPMCQYSAAEGQATDWHLMHYGTMATAGPGMIIVESTSICPEGRISYGDLGLWNKETAYALKRVVDYVRLHSVTPMAVQIGHAGRKASTPLGWEPGGYLAPHEAHGWQTVAPSAVPLSTGGTVPKALDKTEIDQMIKQFVSSAKYAKSAGFEAIELHGAHGYILHQFLSPITNLRTDEYGGSLENRMRFVLAVFDAIKKELPDYPIGIRISATDWIEGGWDLDQSLVLAKELDNRGCAYIHVSTGGLDGALQKLPKLQVGYQLPFAKAIKKVVKMPVIGVGLITTGEEAEAALQDNSADLIAVGRNTLYNPRWTWHAAASLGESTFAANQYLRCQPHGLKKLFE